MKKNEKIKLFLVDDDAVTLKLMEIEFLQQTDFAIETFSTGELCVANLDRHHDRNIGMKSLDFIQSLHPIHGILLDAIEMIIQNNQVGMTI